MTRDADPMVGRSVQAAKADAKVRAIRTFFQGLFIDVAYAVFGVLAVSLADVQFTQAWWVALWAVLIKTVAGTAASYVHRRIAPPSR